jgi:acyl-CoA thioesterase FadM
MTDHPQETGMIETYRGVAFPWLCDQMGHLTTFRYVEMFDTASYHFGYMLGIKLDPSGGLGQADVRQEVDYKAEVAAGSLVLVRSGIVSLGTKSYRSRHVMTAPGGDVEFARMEAVTVFFDLKARRAAPFPDGFDVAAQAHLIAAA